VNKLKKLGLGTVQWGLPYGLNNINGITSPDIVASLLREARNYRIDILDTASQYGRSEEVLGCNPLENFKIVTKTPSFKCSYISDVEIKHLKDAFEHSRKLLSGQKIYALLAHRAENILISEGQRLITEMRRLQDSGLVEKIGVSVYDSTQVDLILKKFKPDVIQLPLSILDQRMHLSGHLEQLKNLGVEIHVRSVFMQGLLLMSLKNIPLFFEPIRPLLTRWHAAAHEQGLTPSQAAIAFVKNLPFVDTVLIGLDNLNQFHSCVKDFSLNASFDSDGLACSDPTFINPSLWPTIWRL
jgi:aryl-alcohol dehydrogenase-like predicted oxidoreductase